MTTGCTLRNATGASACAQALAGGCPTWVGALHRTSTPCILHARGDHGGCGAAGGRLGDDGLARHQRHAAREPAHARRVLAAIERTGYRPEHDRPRARARRHPVARPGHQRALEPVLHGRRRRGRGRRGPRRATRCCSATRARTPSTSCGSCARWPSARSTGMLLAPTVGALEHALPYLESQSVPVVLLDRFVDVGARSGRLRQRAAHRAAGRAPRRPRPPADRDGDRHPRAEHHRRAGARLPDGARAGRASRSTRRWSPRAAPSATGAREAMHALLDLPDPPTAVVSGNNFMTIGLLRAISERGLNVPDDIALVALRRLRMGRPVRAAADRHPPADHRARLARGRAAALAPRGPGPAAAAPSGWKRCSCTATPVGAQVLHLHCRFERNPQGMTTSPREFGITALLFSSTCAPAAALGRRRGAQALAVDPQVRGTGEQRARRRAAGRSARSPRRLYHSCSRTFCGCGAPRGTSSSSSMTACREAARRTRSARCRARCRARPDRR